MRSESTNEWGLVAAAVKALETLRPCGVSTEAYADAGMFQSYAEFHSIAETAILVMLVTENDVEHLNSSWWIEAEA